jgi:hypothetical protein
MKVKVKVGMLAGLAALALAAAVSAGVARSPLPPIDAGSAIPNPVYLQHATTYATESEANAVYLQNAPSDAATPAVDSTYLQNAPSDAATAATPAAPAALAPSADSANGFDWGDALVGAGVAVGAVALLLGAAITNRRYGGDRHRSLAAQQ